MLNAGRTWRQFVLNDQITVNRDVLLMDLRNHGESDHHASMTYTEMAEDLARYLDERALEKVTLAGHNIGGKTAMRFAGMFPDRVKGLISFDTAPIAIEKDKIEATRKSIEMIRALDVEGKTKQGALDVIEKAFTDKGIANMISNNLAYTEDDNHQTVKWCVNLNAIIDNIDSLCGFEYADYKYEGPTFFLNGELSVKHKQEVYTDEFPNAKLI